MALTPKVPRGALVALAVGVGLLLAALAGGRPGREGPPLDPRSDAPLGTSALVTLLERLGAEVDLSVGLPGPDDEVALLLQDRLDEEQSQRLVEWVGAGGRLVVTDPSSRFTPQTAGVGLDALLSEPLERGDCSIAALDGAESVEAGSASRYEVPGPGSSCFGDDSAAYVVHTAFGAGDVVAIGGAAALTNDLLDQRDNAVLAAGLLSPDGGGNVRFVEAPVRAGGGQRSLSELVPSGVKRALIQLGIAFLVYAVWRSIRLGKPVPEHQPVRIAGSELVSAVGRLLSRTGVEPHRLRAPPDQPTEPTSTEVAP